MIRYHLPDARLVSPGSSFEVDGIAYPGNWLELASAEDLAARGIVAEDLPDPVPDLAAVKTAATERISAAVSAAHQRLGDAFLTSRASLAVRAANGNPFAIEQMGKLAAAEGLLLDRLIERELDAQDRKEALGMDVEALAATARHDIEDADTPSAVETLVSEACARIEEVGRADQ